ncbi:MULTISPECIES: BMP family ABC transporter substrate-binding protein [Pontibacillus]|uniref:BMP family ABC transporter substrate-binding protein n=1 Tax=Pontibacillus chungwhensis TaxID=265426 RepID=A0ABY8V6F4_9BACI|nr:MULTISPECIES: BMP family ABC transporter substrate-binding protein [Pontibacillus]MCD5324699.1 BMP family ABC transporter substrate-binding protein [Pontibacillus sp. HN14]WIG00136.1 BMP family ABC transporter substrate-binding protein [Pontibacillus chungwhensis]
MRSLIFMGILLLALTGCTETFGQGKVQKVGMLVESTVHDQAWGQKGYEGLLQIKEELSVDVYFKEDVKTQLETQQAIEAFADKGVNLIFGHGSRYGQYFQELQKEYPDIRFVYFNGSIKGENITSLNFNAHAMGFFGGMLSAEMTESNQVGVIAAFEWQPEIEGFYEGVNYVNPEAEVNIQYVNSWDNKDRALQFYNQMRQSGVDVFYPAGDGFSVPVIEEAKSTNTNAIGYVSDQLSIGASTVLTSTVQHVDKLYVLAAKKYNIGELPEGTLNFDFQEGVITLGEFGEKVPENVRNQITSAVEEYKESGQLPNERETTENES